MSEFVRIDTSSNEKVAILRLERPKVNALNPQVGQELLAAATDLGQRDDIRGVVVWGGPRIFAAGADIAKVVTTARKLDDSISTLQLIQEFPGERIISFAMGQPGTVSRLLCLLVGGEFIYAAIASGKEAASGQLTVSELREIYRMVEG